MKAIYSSICKKRLRFLLCLNLSIACMAQVPGYVISTIAGSGGPASTSALGGSPGGIALDAAGNLYISDGISMVFKLTSQGVLTVFAGGGKASQFLGDSGPATSATLLGPQGLALDGAGNLYIADTLENRIRKVATDGTISTIAGGSSFGPLGDGGQATSAVLSGPKGLALDSGGNLYFADSGNNRVRKIALDGTISTVAGNGKACQIGLICPDPTGIGDGGQAMSAVVTKPTAIGFDSAGNLYITDSEGLIRKVAADGTISTIAGTGNPIVYNGDGGSAKLAGLTGNLTGLAVDSGGTVYVSDGGHFIVRAITADGNINAIAGNNAAAQKGGSVPPVPANTPALSALFLPGPLAVGAGGVIYVCNSGSVLKMTPTGTTISPAPYLSPSFGVTGASAFSLSAGDAIALGSYAEIYGNYLASDSRLWAGGDFNGIDAPTKLDGTTVTVGGQPAYVNYISPGQVNIQVPSTIGTGPQPLVVTTPHGQSAAYAVTVRAEVPRLLAPAVFNIHGTQYGVALFPDGVTFALPVGAIPGVASRPAKQGDTLTLYGLGFGPVTPNVPAGQITQGTNNLTLPLNVSIVTPATPVTVTYSGLAPGIVGLFQFNIVIPKLPAAGPQPVIFSLGAAGQTSVTIATQ